MMPPGPRSIKGGAAGRPLSVRDELIVELVGRFRLMTGEQIRAVAFPSQSSKTPLDRTLLRLTGSGQLARLGRLVGGPDGGSGQFVYQLGRAGWRAHGKSGTYRPQRTADLHTLMITTCGVALLELERQGIVRVVTCQPEPGCHQTVAAIPLTPDAYVELGLPVRRLKYCLWLEIDRDTENRETIIGKCVRYWKAYKAWSDEVFPYVLFVVPDERRQRQIEQIIGSGPPEAQPLFRVCTISTFPQFIHSLWQQG